MFKLGPVVVLRRGEYAALREQLKRATVLRAEWINHDLLRACQAADAHLHEPAEHPLHATHGETVRALLDDALTEAMRG
jgi:hypothetical protein